jgi:lia operon protein LiaF
MKRFSLTKFILSVALVVGGILLLFVNLGVISLEMTNFFVYIIPSLLVLIGLKWLLEGLFSRGRNGSVFFGLLSTLYGLLLLGDIFEYVDFDYDDVLKLWPLLLVYIGIKIFGGSRNKEKRRKIKFTFDTDSKKNEEDIYGGPNNNRGGKESSVFNLVGDGNFTGSNWSVEPMDIHKAILDYDFDFTSAFIPDKETPVKLSGWVGDVKVRLPEDIEFMVEGKANIGDIKIGSYKGEGLGKELYYKTPGYDEATRKIKFSFYFKIIDLRIDQV